MREQAICIGLPDFIRQTDEQHPHPIILSWIRMIAATMLEDSVDGFFSCRHLDWLSVLYLILLRGPA